MPDNKLPTNTGLALVLLGLYAAQSVTGSMVQTALPVMLRDAGMGLEALGFLSLLYLPWVFKPLWAPLVDRFGRPEIWIVACQLALAVTFVAAARFSPVTAMSGLVPFLFLMAIFAATQDIATDGAGVQMTQPQTRFIASGASTVGAYAGFLLVGGVWLWAYSRFGWATSMIVLAVVMLILALPVLRLRIPPQPAAAGPGASVIQSLHNPSVLRGLVLLVLWQGGVRLGGAMAGPMLVDAGMNLEDIAWLRGAGGMIVGLLAAILGTAAVRHYGNLRMLALSGVLLLIGFAGLGWWSLMPGPVWLLGLFQLLLMTATALSFIALYAAMMDWCRPGQIATDFALLQAVDSGIAILSGILAGQLAGRLGYASVFLLAAILLLLAAPMIRSRLQGQPPTPAKSTSFAENEP